MLRRNSGIALLMLRAIHNRAIEAMSAASAAMNLESEFIDAILSVYKQARRFVLRRLQFRRQALPVRVEVVR
jgi:hypothetical protein